LSMDGLIIKIKQCFVKVPILYHFKATAIGQYLFKITYSFLTLRRQKRNLKSTVNNFIVKQYHEDERYLVVGDNGKKEIEKKYSWYRDCAVCRKHTTSTDAFYNGQFSFRRCKDCGFVWMQPIYCDNVIASIYNGKEDSKFKAITNYVEKNFLKKTTLEIEKPPLPPSFYIQKLLWSLKQIGGRANNLLDIGCQNGNFLLEAKHYFHDVQGVEMNVKSAKYAMERGLIVHNMPIEEIKLPDAFFDVITMNQVIEHIKDPSIVLEKAFKLLKRNGVLFISTPNIDGISYKMFKGAHSLLRGNSHISMFNIPSLGRLGNSVGFKTENSGTYYLDVSLYDLIAYYYYGLVNNQDKFLHRYNVHLYGYVFFHALQFLMMPFLFNRYKEFHGPTKEWGSYLYMIFSKP
jgi:2-polyprenyl-3-methyl-5-hydroxy-6-metoxy-1,4-benzoquinol methylase